MKFSKKIVIATLLIPVVWGMSPTKSFAEVQNENQETFLEDKSNSILDGLLPLDNQRSLNDTYTDEAGTIYEVNVGGRSLTSTVRSWSQLRSAINNTNVSVINITSSFTSANSALNEVNRALTLNFSNLSTITVNHNQPIRIGANGRLNISAQNNRQTPIIQTRNTLSQAFIQGGSNSLIQFVGDVVVGNQSTLYHSRPFIKSQGIMTVVNGHLDMNEALEVERVEITQGAGLSVKSNHITPLKITQNGQFIIRQGADFVASHDGLQSTVAIQNSGKLTMINPRTVDIKSEGVTSMNPLIASDGEITIQSVHTAFWRNGNLGLQPNQTWNESLSATLSGANGNTVLGSNIHSFTERFDRSGFDAYRRFSTGTHAPELEGTEEVDETNY